MVEIYRIIYMKKLHLFPKRPQIFQCSSLNFKNLQGGILIFQPHNAIIFSLEKSFQLSKGLMISQNHICKLFFHTHVGD
jgi:hypothetical protein